MTATAATAGWRVRRVSSKSGFTTREVFTSPEGVEYVRCGPDITAEIELPLKTRGLLPLRLVRRDRPARNLPPQAAAGAGQS